MKSKEVVVCFDADCDGRLTEEEATQALMGMGVYLTHDKEREWLDSLPFEQGRCDAAALQQSIEQLYDARNPRTRLTEMFKTFDPENSGYISSHEFHEVLRTIGTALTEHDRQDLVNLAQLGDKIDYVQLLNKLL